MCLFAENGLDEFFGRMLNWSIYVYLYFLNIFFGVTPLRLLGRVAANRVSWVLRIISHQSSKKCSIKGAEQQPPKVCKE